LRGYLVSITVIISLIFMAGCENQAIVNNDSENQTPNQAEKSYISVSEYNELINGQNFKTGVLNISRKDDYIYLSMNISISPELEEIMMNTKEEFYFNFADIEGRDSLTKVIAETPTFIEGDLEKLKDGDNYLISQQIKIKPDISSIEIKEILSPEIYELQVLDENGQLVAVTIGLDINLIY
jgi:hypothetical protein